MQDEKERKRREELDRLAREDRERLIRRQEMDDALRLAQARQQGLVVGQPGEGPPPEVEAGIKSDLDRLFGGRSRPSAPEAPLTRITGPITLGGGRARAAMGPDTEPQSPSLHLTPASGDRSPVRYRALAPGVWEDIQNTPEARQRRAEAEERRLADEELARRRAALRPILEFYGVPSEVAEGLLSPFRPGLENEIIGAGRYYAEAPERAEDRALRRASTQSAIAARREADAGRATLDEQRQLALEEARNRQRVEAVARAVTVIGQQGALADDPNVNDLLRQTLQSERFRNLFTSDDQIEDAILQYWTNVQIAEAGGRAGTHLERSPALSDEEVREARRVYRARIRSLPRGPDREDKIAQIRAEFRAVMQRGGRPDEELE